MAIYGKKEEKGSEELPREDRERLVAYVQEVVAYRGTDFPSCDSLLEYAGVELYGEEFEWDELCRNTTYRENRCKDTQPNSCCSLCLLDHREDFLNCCTQCVGMEKLLEFIRKRGI